MLCDFGLAKVLEETPTGLTTEANPAYTLRYAAPELLRESVSLHTLPSDVWAWGCLFLAVRYESLAPTVGYLCSFDDRS